MFDCCYWGDTTYERGWDYIERLTDEFWFGCFTQRTTDKKFIRKVISECKIVVLPYRFMAVRPPLTLVESMALGKCVVTSDLGGNNELIEDGVNGFIEDFNDIDKVIRHITILLDCDSIREEVGKLAQKKIKKLYTNGEYQKILNAYAI
jgi:glycosyltransferase involved in cell wall biosynthesis